MSTILEDYEIDAEILTQIVKKNPSLRGMLLGYVAEYKFEELFLQHPLIEVVGKADDHDRKHKGDRNIKYRDRNFVLEVKSLQTNTIKRITDLLNPGGYWAAKAQVDASDNRTITLPTGHKVTTTCLLEREFDILAVNCFAFEGKWRFVFAKNEDLPHTTAKKYSDEEKRYLLATTVEVTWPPRPPFTDDLISLFESDF